MRRRTGRKAKKAPTGADRAIRVLVATQPALWSDVLGRTLERERDIRVVGQAHNEDQIREAAAEGDPQVIILDYEALGPNCEALIGRLRRIAPAARTLVLSSRSGDETAIEVLRAGAAGLVGKQLGYAAMLAALRAVAGGELWAHRRVTARAFDQLLMPGQRNVELPAQLTKREWEVIEGVGKGLRNREIARSLGITERTVKSHMNNIFGKTKVTSRFALTLWAKGENKAST